MEKGVPNDYNKVSQEKSFIQIEESLKRARENIIKTSNFNNPKETIKLALEYLTARRDYLGFLISQHEPDENLLRGRLKVIDSSKVEGEELVLKEILNKKAEEKYFLDELIKDLSLGKPAAKFKTRVYFSNQSEDEKASIYKSRKRKIKLKRAGSPKYSEEIQVENELIKNHKISWKKFLKLARGL